MLNDIGNWIIDQTGTGPLDDYDQLSTNEDGYYEANTEGMLETTFDNQYNDWEQQQEHRNSNLPNVTEIERKGDDINVGSTYYIGALYLFGFNYDESQYQRVNAIQTVISDSYEDQRDNMSGIPHLDKSRKGNIWYYERNDPEFGTVQSIASEKGFNLTLYFGTDQVVPYLIHDITELLNLKNNENK